MPCFGVWMIDDVVVAAAAAAMVMVVWSSCGWVGVSVVYGQTILPNLWHARRRTDNSAKSLTRSMTVPSSYDEP